MHQEHQEIDERLRKVYTAKTVAEARRLLKSALNSSREHFRMEELQVFPLLERTLKPETLVELGREWVSAG
jgi:hemerythrin-like domain-containing protein